ncbi:MAG: nucleotidyl transferase AbiEii/AbiGii toxin family protein [Dehalococcoidia bacterium]
MIARAELQRLANREQVGLGVLEKDYVLTEVLNALHHVPELSKELVFKGGTALRKVYFPYWRYSEDLDFTVKRDMAKEELYSALESWQSKVEEYSGIRLTVKMLHKPDGYARIRIQYVASLNYPGMIYMDLTFDEPVCLEPEVMVVMNDPFPGKGDTVLAYPLEELLAEKLRSLIERGKSRDYYDVWRLLGDKASTLDLHLLGAVLETKLAHKGLPIPDIGDFLPDDFSDLERYWNNDLGQQVNPLPRLESVISDLRSLLADHVVPYLSRGAP